MIGGMLAFDLGLLIELVPSLSSRSWRWAVGVLATAGMARAGGPSGSP